VIIQDSVLVYPNPRSNSVLRRSGAEPVSNADKIGTNLPRFVAQNDQRQDDFVDIEKRKPQQKKKLQQRTPQQQETNSDGQTFKECHQRVMRSYWMRVLRTAYASHCKDHSPDYRVFIGRP